MDVMIAARRRGHDAINGTAVMIGVNVRCRAVRGHIMAMRLGGRSAQTLNCDRQRKANPFAHCSRSVRNSRAALDGAKASVGVTLS